MKKFLSANWSYLFSGIFITVIFFILCILGQNIYIPVHDNLDSNIVWIKMLADNNLIFKMSGEVPFLGGIDRMYLYSPFKLYLLFYAVLPLFWAYIAAMFFKILFSISGFVFLCKVINKDYEENKHIYVLCGLAYGLIPVFPSASVSFASLPFLMAFLILYYKNPDKKYLPVFLLYPVFSDVVLFGFFICGYLACYILFDWIKSRQIKISSIMPLTALILGYVITEYNLFYTMLFSPEISIRAEMKPEFYNFFGCTKLFFEGFIKGQYHACDLHAFIVMPICLICVLISNIIFIKNKNYKDILISPINLVLIFIILNCIFYALDYYEPVKNFVEKILPPLKGFSYARTIWLNPFLWYFAFAVSISMLKKIKIYRYLLIFSAIGVLIFCKADYNHFYLNLHQYELKLKNKPLKILSYSQFYSENLFAKIKRDIKYQGEWSCAFAMHPAVLEYNGIKTLDGYLSYYSLNYKNKFKELIKPQLIIDKKNFDYFNNWGGRAYLFSDKVTFNPVINLNQEKVVLRINPDIFKEMNGRYIFSRVFISNYKDLGLNFVNKYSDDISPYEIYVYSLTE